MSAIWAEATGGMIVVTVVAAITWLCMRRRKPLDWAAAGKKALAARERRIERARHDELVGWVLQGTEVLGLEIPVKSAGSNPMVVTFHPTSRKHAYFRDLPNYKSAVQRGDVSPMHAHFGKSPEIVSRWSDEHLRKWLSDRADELPTAASG